MKKIAGVLALVLILAFAGAMADGTWAYGALPLKSEGAGVDTIYYAEDYFAVPGIVNPVSAEAYTEEEIADILAMAAEGEYIEAPKGAMIGMTLFADPDSIYWYDAENAEKIVGHADPLVLDPESGIFATAEGEAVAEPLEAGNWAYGALPLNSEAAGVGTIYYAEAYYAMEGIVNPVSAEAYTQEEIAEITALLGDGEYIEAPEAAVIGMSLFTDADSIFWYDAESAAKIVSHADPLALDAETGNLFSAEGDVIAEAME